MVPVGRPLLGKEEEKAVVEVLRSGMLAQGHKVEELEKDFAKKCGVKYAVATSNGTTALHLALLACGIKQGDEVITTPFTFAATGNAIVYVGAKPVFADICEDDYNIDPTSIEKLITRKTKAILPVHLYGQAARMTEIMKIARKHNLLVIEDACQAHLAQLGNPSRSNSRAEAGKKVGSFGIAGAFSMYPTKNMTTGEGGMVTTNSKKISDLVSLLRNHGMGKRYYHDIIGYNFRMTDIGAAIGVEQLKKLSSFITRRRQIAVAYDKAFKDIPGIITPVELKGNKHVYHQYTIRITPDFGWTRDEVIAELGKNDIGVAIFYPVPLYRQKAYKGIGRKGSCKVTEAISKEVVSLPIHPALSDAQIKKIIKVIKGMYGE